MAFPTTSVIENFTGADGTKPPNANWTQIYNEIQIQSNTAAGVADADNIAAWDTATFGADSEAYLTITTKPQTAYGIAVLIRLTTLSVSTIDGYMIAAVAVSGSSNDTTKVYRIDNGASTQLGSDITQEWDNGDALGAEIISTTIKVYRKPSGGSWAQLGGTFDGSAYTAAGYIGINCDGTTCRGDDFGGGTVVAASSIEQEGFRFRNDDGSESTATWKDSQDTNITLAADTAARLRVILNATGDPDSIGAQLEYRYKPSGGAFGGWTKVSS